MQLDQSRQALLLNDCFTHEISLRKQHQMRVGNRIRTVTVHHVVDIIYPDESDVKSETSLCNSQNRLTAYDLHDSDIWADEENFAV